MKQIKSYLLCFMVVLWLSNYNVISFTYDTPRTTISNEEYNSNYRITKILISLKDNLYRIENPEENITPYQEIFENQLDLKLDSPNLPLKNYSLFSGLAGAYWSYTVESCNIILNTDAKKRITEVVYNTTNSYATSNCTMKYANSAQFDLDLSDIEKDAIIVQLPASLKHSAKIDNNIELYLSPKSYSWVEFTPFCYKIVGTISLYNWHGELKSEKIVTTLIPKNTDGLLEGIYYVMESNNSP